MNVFTKIAKKLGFNKSSSDSVALNELYRFLGIDPETDEKVMSEATYFACLKILSEAIGKMPLKLLKYNDKNGVMTMRKHPLFKVLHERPNPYMTATSFWSTVEYNRNHHGNAYVWIRGAGKNMTLWILPSESVEVWYDDMKILADQPDIYYLYSAGGKIYKFGSEEILHFKTSNSLDGITGVSVQNQLKNTISGSIKSQKMLNKMYESGFTAKAVLNYTGSLSDANVETLLKNISGYAKGELKEKGVENVIPIPLGFKLEPLNVKLADNQYIEVKQYTSGQIAAAFGIKPYQYNDLTKSSYASAEAQQLSFYVDTLLYIIKQYEEELTYKLLNDREISSGYHFKFNVAVILRADLATQINTLSTGVSNFIYTPNEARAMLDLEAKEGGDQLLGNGGSIPVNMMGAQYNHKSEEDSEEDSKEDPKDDPPKDDEEGGSEGNERSEEASESKSKRSRRSSGRNL